LDSRERTVALMRGGAACATVADEHEGQGGDGERDEQDPTCPSRPFKPTRRGAKPRSGAHDLTVWTHLLLFDDEHAGCEPKRLRYRLLHVAGKLTRYARQLTLHLPADSPWAAAIAKAFKRLAALPA
jgi:hypothetical protein